MPVHSASDGLSQTRLPASRDAPWRTPRPSRDRRATLPKIPAASALRPRSACRGLAVAGQNRRPRAPVLCARLQLEIGQPETVGKRGDLQTGKYRRRAGRPPNREHHLPSQFLANRTRKSVPRSPHPNPPATVGRADTRGLPRRERTGIRSTSASSLGARGRPGNGYQLWTMLFL